MIYLANRITDIFITRNIIEEDMADVYRYGCEILLSSILTSLSILFVAFLLKSFELGLIYMILTIPLKLSAGGYHASTYKNCFVLSNLAFIALICVHKTISDYLIPEYLWLTILYSSSYYIFLKAPVQNPNQPLSPEKVRKNKCLAHSYLLIDCCLLTLLTITMPTTAYIHFSILCILLIALLIIPAQKGGTRL